MASRAPSPYHDLDRWELEGNLIQLDTSPRLRPSDDRGSSRRNIDREGGESSGDRRRYFHSNYSLIDLDDGIPGGDEEESDEQMAQRLHAEWNGADTASLKEWHNSDTALKDHSSNSTKTGDQLCAQCETLGPSRSYCNVCGVLCDKCWQLQLPHKKGTLAPGGIPHEKTDYSTAKKIENILTPKITDAEQEILHQKDQDTIWFGIIREDGQLPLFRDYGRYGDLMVNTSLSGRTESSSMATRSYDTRYPSLVAFVGQTGAGKSTIIKLVIDLCSRDEKTYATPVIGSVGKDVPTSGDVHLYPDPRTVDSDNPILYADCEGLEGGEREPLGAWRKPKDRGSKIGRIGPSERDIPNINHTSERQITWATTNAKRSRGFAVTHLYPRLLYTFSDVVVFVLKNPRVIESVFEKLIDWAAAALEKSSNQPVLPHAIIVLNASENNIDPILWDVSSATSVLLESLSKTVSQNATFKKYSLFWSERNRDIKTIEQLFLSYYSSFTVVRIPTIGRPNLIKDQIAKLYNNIESACTKARRRKRELRMLLDADELQSYLQFAFDHFACNLDIAFDFVEASFTNSPIPLDFGGNILKLAINLMELWENEADGETIFTELSYMVASCIMLESARHKIRGTAEQIFPLYLEHIDAALENFCDRHWPCEYVKPGGGARCVNVRSGHGSKGHQLKNGKVLAVGSYVSHFSFSDYQVKFQNDTYSRLDGLLNLLHSRLKNDDESEVQAAAGIHKGTVLDNFFNHTARGRTTSFISHSTCFSCLFEPPEHALPCGHVLCTPCLIAYGKFRGKTVVELNGCPLETLITPRRTSWKAVLKPAAAGTRILTLDGGGIRGIVELEILRLIERAMGGRIPIQSFFDLIVGTSTGGIITLGLAAKSWSVEECTRHFEDLCQKAFTRRTFGNVYGVGWLINNHHHSKYETQPLQEALISAFSEDEYLFGGSRPHESFGSDIKVAVTTTSAAGNPVVLANYNRLCNEKLPYHFQRPEKLESELKIWEAARATAAAPTIFKPLCHHASKQTYTDGALYHNNPIQIADKERKLIWPNMEAEWPGIVVSIGTGFSRNSRPTDDKSMPLRWGVFSHGKSLYKIAKNHIAMSLDSEATWETYMNILQPPSIHRSRYVRLNLELAEDPPKLDDLPQMKYLQDLTRDKFMNDSRIQSVALQLIASSFYFEKSAPAASKGDHAFRCKGNIYSRLLPDSSEIIQLGNFFRRAMQDGFKPHFLIQEVNQEQYSESVVVSTDVIERMIRRGQFSMSKITVQISREFAYTNISLCLNDVDTYTISRFPRSLMQDDENKRETRQNLNNDSGRWASRTASQKMRRKRWIPPDLTQTPWPSSTISRYRESDYILGNSSPAKLGSFAGLFKSGINPTEGQAESEIPPKRNVSFSTRSIRGEVPNAGAVSPADYPPNVAELSAEGELRCELDGQEISAELESPSPIPDERTVNYLRRNVQGIREPYDGYLHTDADRDRPLGSTNKTPDKGKSAAKSNDESRWNFF